MLIGGAGFIGSNIAKELIQLGDQVIIYDNFINYLSPFSNNYEQTLKMRFEGLLKDVTLVRGDVRHKIHILKAMREHKPNKIIHLAAIPDTQISNNFPEDSISINLNGTVNVLEVMRDIGWIEKFIFTSSSCVYGDFQYHPADEKHPLNPIDVYGGGKLAGEILTKSYAQRYKMPFTIIRPSAVYGPGDSHRRVIRIFIENAFQGKTLMLDNGGSSMLDFSFVEDVAHGFVLALNSRKADNETFNITCGQGRSLKELAEIIKVHIPNLKTDVQALKENERMPERGGLDITKANKLLGYKPKVQLEEGVKRYIEWYKERKLI